MAHKTPTQNVFITPMKVSASATVVRRIVASAFSSLWTLVILLAASEVIYVKLVGFHAVNTTSSVTIFLALIAVLFVLYAVAYLVLNKRRNSSPSALTVVVAGAILFRLTLLLVGVPPDTTWKQRTSRLRADIRSEAVTFDSYLLFDNDIWRYLWDGHVGAHGVNPYQFEPRNAKLDALAPSLGGDTLWSDIRANVNHPDIPTIYPPFAQLVFRVAHAIAPGSVVAMKLLLVTCELLTILLLSLTLRILNRPSTDLILYAWNPLVIKATAASGHMEAILAMLLAMTIYFVARRWHSAAALAWGIAVLAKTSPVVLLPFLMRRIGWRRSAVGAAVVLIGYVPYWDKQGSPLAGLRAFVAEWQFNSGFVELIEWLVSPFSSHPMLLAKVAGTLTFLVLLLWLVHSDDGNESTLALYSVTTLGGLLVLSPTVMPWYLVSLIPLAVIARTSSWIQFSALVCLAFLVMIGGTERPWALWIEFGMLTVLLWREFTHRDALCPRKELGLSELRLGGTI